MTSDPFDALDPDGDADALRQLDELLLCEILAPAGPQDERTRAEHRLRAPTISVA
jgi:hypothetical protein